MQTISAVQAGDADALAVGGEGEASNPIVPSQEPAMQAMVDSLDGAGIAGAGLAVVRVSFLVNYVDSQ